MKRLIILCLVGVVASVGYCQKLKGFPKSLNRHALEGTALRSGITGINQYEQIKKYNQQNIQQWLNQVYRNRNIDKSKLLELEEHNRKLKGLIKQKPILGLEVLQEIEKKWLEQTPDSMIYKKASYSLVSGDTTNYVKFLRLAVKRGYGPALYDYGRMLVLGKYVEEDSKQGWQLIQKAAEQNEPSAMHLLGMEYYYYGMNHPLDAVKGFDWLKKAANAGYFPANLETGTIYLGKDDTTNAIRYYTIADDLGWDHRAYVVYYDKYYESLLRDADVILGNYFYDNEKSSKDINAAIKYWSHAAYFGHGEAAYHVGFRLLEGTEVEQDLKLGVTYMEMAARLGNPEAQAYYGDCYMNGVGVERDSLKAIEWWKKAGEAGHAGSQYCLACKYYCANDNDSTIYWGEKSGCRDSSVIQYCVGMAYFSKDNTEEAKNWWEKAAEQNQPDACWWLSNLVWESDSITAFSYLQKAAELGHAEAICDVGVEYINGGLVKKDIDKAIDYFKQSAEAGSANAYRNLGAIYYFKEYGRKNRKMAVSYWKQGSEMNPELIETADCQYNYGISLKRGEGIKKDKEAAIFWLKLAARNGSEKAKEELKKMHIGIEEGSETVNTGKVES